MSPYDEDEDLRALGELAQPAAPPPDLEDRVVAALRDRSLIRSPRSDREPARRHWRFAAALLLAAVGGWIARGIVPGEPLGEPPGAPSGRGREYLLVFAEPRPLTTSKTTSELVGEYRDWSLGLAERGHLVTGRRLLDDGLRVAAEPDGTLDVAPEKTLAEATGFFLIRADSEAEALDLVADAPHLAYGGELSLREVARDG